MGRWTYKWSKRLALLAVGAFCAFIVIRAVDSQRGPPLELWHSYVPHDLHAERLDQLDWGGYMAAEEALFAELRREVTDRLPPEARTDANRYFAGAPIYPGRFEQDWNRSYVMEPDIVAQGGTPRGAVVLLHGLTDAPYSLRHIARRYREAGFVAIGIRNPAHGTVPAALTDTVWEDWAAATRLAMREARRRAGPDGPIHIVGFSNGGALALKQALDAIEDPRVVRPDRLVLISPMIGITSFARFAGLAGLPALLPSFAKAAWLSRIPEFNPFKYNSFPVNGARQSHRLTQALQQQIRTLSRAGRLDQLAPVLTFQSVMDFTVSTRAVISALYEFLPANGSELVLFDRNRNTKLGPLLRPAFDAVLARMVPPAPRNWRLTFITNANEDRAEVVARTVAAGATEEQEQSLGLLYPRNVYSLSHVALPFPPDDSLYGNQPGPEPEFGVSLGALAAHGEVGVLILALDSLVRISWNPFYGYLMGRISEVIPAGAAQAP
ncbi:alpha/beta hydrolase [Roseococcus pinisoli]|uniref:Alpha/beta hydrolase n=1 Tax=Roseococcus pinisoli TaxID=2835040 RepID=A0ABS5QD40_9PROT|nr:alpha/beta hydrolase [Roseococcus pinisoli]MBS7811604.1 alpha/beta hydrolase [Roseococcus pinisoli]